MTLVHLVPRGEEVVSISEDGTEVVAAIPTADDAFAAAVKKLQLHKRRKRKPGKSTGEEQQGNGSDTNPIDSQETEPANKIAKSSDPKEISLSVKNTANEQVSGNPFEDAHKELAIACYEIQQLHQLVNLIGERSLFRLESLQAEGSSSLTGFTNLIMAFEMKKRALHETIKILESGCNMLRSARRAQHAYVEMIETLKNHWRLQAVAHAFKTSGTLRAQEPLALDCSFYSAGYRGKAARQRQTKNSARLLINSTATGDEELVTIDIDKTSLKTIRFELKQIIPTLNGKPSALEQSVLLESSPVALRENMDEDLQKLHDSEFCTELFQVLSVEAVRSGELSSGGGFVAEANTIGSARPKVAVAENLLDRVSVAINAQHVFSASLVPVEDDKVSPGTPQPQIGGGYIRVAGIIAQQHLRNVHRGNHDASVLGTFASSYLQMDAFERINHALDEVSVSLTKGLDGSPRKLFQLRFSWINRDAVSLLELWISAEVLIRCKLEGGHLSLSSISVSKGRLLPHDWKVAQQAGNHLFVGPRSVSKLQNFVRGCIRHEFLRSLQSAITNSMAVGSSGLAIETNIKSGSLSWINGSTGQRVRVDVSWNSEGSFLVLMQNQDVTRPTLRQIVTEILLLAAVPPAQ